MAGNSAGATVRDEMGSAVQAKTDARLTVWQKKVLRTDRKGSKTECLFADGTSILLSDFLASFVRAKPASPAASLREATSQASGPERGWRLAILVGLALAVITAIPYLAGYVSQPRKDKRDNLFVSGEVPGARLSISAINLRCEALRDYFFVGNRRRPWERQPSFYELLVVDPKVSPTELRLAFKLRTLELHTARAPVGDIRAAERVFNILAHPELRACYDALLNDPTSPALFPYGGFGSLLVAGDRSRDCSTFYGSRILAFLPEQRSKYFRVPLRKVEFYADHAIYRDSHHKLEVFFDRASLPLLWDSSWNQWKHLLGTKIGIKATFIQSGKYHHRAGAWHLVHWQTALPSRIEVALPANIPEQIDNARETYHRFGQFADALDHIRARIESTPVERADLQKLCAALGIPGDFDVALITWKPDYDAFYYRQLFRRARHVYLFRSEYVFDLERAVIVETPQLGHATYLFSKPADMSEFLAIYSRVTREEILRNRGNIAERLGFSGRLIHGQSWRAWLKELKTSIGEVVDYAEAAEVSD